MAEVEPARRPLRFLSRLPSRFKAGTDRAFSGPIRGELLGADELAEKARSIAEQQQISPRVTRRGRTPLLGRLTQTRRILEDAYSRLAAGADRDVDIGPAGEWLLDNFHVVQEHIREVNETMPRGYYRELPELSSGPLAGYPRVYELAITLVSHTEARIDRENLDLFVSAFQSASPLSLGELWAIPAMLRLALVESVRRMALRTVERMDEIERADAWAARFESAEDEGVTGLRAVLDAFGRTPPRLTAVFVSRLMRQLRLTSGSHPRLAKLEQWIGDHGLGAEEAAFRATQHLALTQVIIAHSITSLRAIAHLDWPSFVEGQSATEAVLQDDPASYYSRMTFRTRDRYRHVVERIAKRTGRREEAVARLAIGLARAAAVDGPSAPRRSHVGYFLIDDGLPRLEAATGYRPKPGEAVHRWVMSHPDFVFGGGIAAATVAALALLLWLAGPEGRGAWPLVLLFGFIPAFDLAISGVNQLITGFLPPRTLPKLDLHGPDGIPPEFRTAVVIPTLFGSVEAVQEALGTLEVQFLANRKANLHFAVLSDFPDASEETCEDDAAIIEAAVEGVRALNARYAPESDDAFYLFHRHRRWNPQQGVWMGWERKRGKLAEFNRFLRGTAGDAFPVVVGDVEPLRSVRYVITLDADTVLPPDAAPDLVGAIAHPLNRAVYDEELGRVVRGYGILQPRVGISLPSAYRSRFAVINSGHPGVDPYTTAVSDVYQDLYGEGSFTGKGIYDVDAFEEATRGRFPENTLLSHDLIEGSYARAGLATDITVYDDYPSRYLTYTRRKHRWIRGDWQLLHWLTRRVAGPDGPEANRLRMLSRWKILDNLRRSTVELGQLLFLIAGWTVLPGSPLRWTALGIGAIGGAWLISLLLATLRPPLDRSWRAYYASVGRDMLTSVQQVGLAIAMLPHQAWVSADAIGRTLWRLFVSRRFLLEWQTASGAESAVPDSARGVWRTMAPAVTMAGAFGLLAAVAAAAGDGAVPPWHVTVAIVPLLVLWTISPALAHALSASGVPTLRRLTGDQQAQAMRLALLHWRFFDRFVDADTQWLAPDNYQDDPLPVVAMRSSPTNIGLQLLAIGSARDLGFITTADMTRRLELVFRSLERLRRFRGHFFNWYDLKDLEVLEPAYVSTVDSGNLAGHLLALRQACLQARDTSDSLASLETALQTALALAQERLARLATTYPAVTAASLEIAGVCRERVRITRASMAPSRGAARPAHSLAETATSLRSILGMLHSAALPLEEADEAEEWILWSVERVDAHLADAAAAPAEVSARLEALAERAYRYATEMDFRFLYDEDREIFSIGYQHASRTLDASYYDLFASEARLASFVAIAKNDVPVDHWFRLGRTLTRAAGETALVSWSGSMFEYLMPALVMRSFPFTVLDQTYRGAVRRQIAYGRERGVPWGVSESAYNLRDRHLTYQYRAFGVPDLALKRGLGRDLVIAPYASLLAVMVDPQRSLANLSSLERKGALGPFGFRDSLDYTRPDPGSRFAVVGNYMAHHIGMGLAALTNALMGQVWHERFHAEPLVRSVELLLHEAVPRRLAVLKARDTRADEAFPNPEVESPAVREFERTDTPQPHIGLLGRAPYTVMVTHCGGGFSRYEDRAVTRWRADGTRDATGQFCYIKDVTNGRVWSVAHQPVCAPADWYRALLATDRVTFHRSDGGIETRTEIAVVPEDAAEVRCVTVTNNSAEVREVELTSYGEIVLGSADADRAHPAFANLFVETEWHAWCTAVTATRRPRSATEPPLWCVHVVDSGERRVGEVSCETDRARFLGRGATPQNPAALAHDGPLSGTTGAVLDPIFSLRTRVRLAPGDSATVAFTTLVATTRERAFHLASRYHDPHSAQRALDLAWTSQQVELRELDVTPADAAVFQEMAGYLLYPRPELRAPESELRENRGSLPLLWKHGISGDWPILLATIDSQAGLPTLRQLFAAHHYWRRRGLTIDLVILNTQVSSYLQELHDWMIAAMFSANDSEMDRPGGVFIRRGDGFRADELLMLRATARVSIFCDGRSMGRLIEHATTVEQALPTEPGLLETQPRGLAQHEPPASVGGRRIATHVGRDGAPLTPMSPRPTQATTQQDVAALADAREEQAPLRFDNGYGGLTDEGDYEIRVGRDLVPPAPWANVVANRHGGFVVSERGGGFTWAENSYFFRLTPWHNDPVSDPTSEVLYLRDSESGELWSATPAPIAQEAPYVVRHAAGASTFDFEHHGIATRLTLAMAEDEAVKLSVLRVTNRDARPRRIAVTAYVEWTLGVDRERMQHHVHTSFDPELGAVMARSFHDPQFADGVAFCALSEPVTGHTGDR
ncbi:MAG TPA: glucoamylase family protein, partial [Longimicrobiaceae bacterium]